MFYNGDRWREIIFTGKARTYEETIKSYWRLFGQAGEVEGFTAEQYYNATTRSAAAQLYCTQEISDQITTVEAELMKLSVATGTLEERGAVQQVASDAIEKLINLMRVDLGLKPITGAIVAADDETAKALLEQWGHRT